MIATARNTKAAPKKVGHGIPFDEMCRLMRVYGPTKCLRNRKAGAAHMKADSVKRKFYRWFPDLDTRFVRDNAGYFRPRFGHAFEMKYREEMRTKDGEILSRKRVGRRRQRRSREEGETTVSSADAVRDQALLSANVPRAVSPSGSFCEQAPARPVLFSASSSPLHPHLAMLVDAEIEIDPEPVHVRASSDSIIAGTEPLDDSFVARQDIFDSVDESFYGTCNVQHCPGLAPVEDCPGLGSSSFCGSSSEEEQDPSDSFCDGDSHLTGDILEKSMEDCCKEILAWWDDDGIVSGWAARPQST